MGGDRIFEVSGIADERPTGTGAAFDETNVPAKSTNSLDAPCFRQPRVECRRYLPNQPPVGQMNGSPRTSSRKRSAGIVTKTHAALLLVGMAPTLPPVRNHQ